MIQESVMGAETASAELLEAVSKVRSRNDFVSYFISTDWYFTPGCPENWRNVKPENAKKFRFFTHLDLDSVAGKPCREKDECVLHTTFEAERDGLAQIGISADWWCEACINGECVFSTMDKGNGTTHYVPEDHPVFFKVKKGENHLALHIIRGAASWTLAVDRLATMPEYISSGITVGPWLANPDTNSVTVRFYTYGKAGAGVEYRKTGTENWTVLWDKVGCIIAQKMFHSVNLTGLEPDTKYEYRPVLLDADHPEKKIPGEIHTFRTFAENQEKVSFLCLADLQFDPGKQAAYMSKLFEAADVKSCDFVVFNGDIGSNFDDQYEDVLKVPFSTYVRLTNSEIPLVSVRGNHELRGREAYLFPEYFGLADGRTYGIFRAGETAFLVFDSWEDKPADSPGADYVKYNLDEEFYAEEAKFLKDALETEKWKSARNHIMICHGSAYSHYDGCNFMPFVLQRLTDPYFEGIPPKHKLDLWIAGHTHMYSRSFPGSSNIALLKEYRAPFKTGKTYTYPVVTGGGTGGSPECSIFRVDIVKDSITVRAWDQDGKLFDHVVFGRDGSIQELVPIQHTDYGQK